MQNRETLLARAFAGANADEQGDLINHMARELYVQCGGGDGMNTQCCYLSDKLNEDGRKLIKELYAYILLREGDMNG